MTVKTEPAITVGSLGAVVAAVLALLTAFGLPISEGQQVAILGVVAVVAPFVVAVLIRPKVTPVASAAPQRRGFVGE